MAGGMGLEPRESDFDQTLYEWGASEGAIVELPVLGVYTSRHAYGTIVDIVLNPARVVLPFSTPWLNSAVIDVLDTRYSLGDTIELHAVRKRGQLRDFTERLPPEPAVLPRRRGDDGLR